MLYTNINIGSKYVNKSNLKSNNNNNNNEEEEEEERKEEENILIEYTQVNKENIIKV